MSQSSTHFFVLSLTYIRPLEEVDPLMDAHVSYLKSGYERGYFLLSGRKEPRTGGIILARAASQEALQSIIADDPFAREGVATYEVIEFLPSRSIDELAAVIAD
jgi:uncharacterized protein YciI